MGVRLPTDLAHRATQQQLLLLYYILCFNTMCWDRSPRLPAWYGFVSYFQSLPIDLLPHRTTRLGYSSTLATLTSAPNSFVVQYCDHIWTLPIILHGG